MKTAFLITFLAAGSVAAEEWSLRPGDVPLPQADLEALAGQTLTFYDDGRSKYSAGGAYSYTYSAKNGGGTAFGSYHIAEDGSVCTEFQSGFQRCDLYVRNGTRMILVTEKGERFPVRPPED